MGEVRPFHCGTQFGDWQAANCLRCTKYKEEEPWDGGCEIDCALGVAYIGDGTVSREIAERMGYFEHNPPGELPSYNWRCREFERRTEC